MNAIAHIEMNEDACLTLKTRLAIITSRNTTGLVTIINICGEK